MKKLNIGLFGFGVVGKGFYDIIQSRPELGVEIKKIAVRKAHNYPDLPVSLLANGADEIYEDGGINVVVELISDADAAFDICSKALSNGKHVVSANKKMIAEHLVELLALQQKHGKTMLYEAAVCGSIPVMRNLSDYFGQNGVTSIAGIVNGSTNYILSKMTASRQTFGTVLADAQKLGFAESDPTLDVEGEDAAYKLSLLIHRSTGQVVAPETIPTRGIASIASEDIQFARQQGMEVKLVASYSRAESGEVKAMVAPVFVGKDKKLAGVVDEYNGIEIKSSWADDHFLSGKGAGAFPTAAAVLSDVLALKVDYAYKNISSRSSANGLSGDEKVRVYLSFPKGQRHPFNLISNVLLAGAEQQRAYVVAQISWRTLIQSGLFEDKSYSMILLGNEELVPPAINWKN
jgi:homoserine dehydrogenase